jgi:single-stranded-DNA-specific exonuclease
LALERGLAKGSGRSVGYNLVDILSECTDCIETWGGHKMAIGISILPEKVDEFRAAFECAIERYSCEHTAIEEEIEIASIIDKNDVTDDLVNELETYIQPYGQNNFEPIFCLCHVQFANCSEFFGQNNKHFRFWIEREKLPWITGIAWNMHDNYPEEGRDIDILVTLNYDSWNNERFIVAKLIDWKYSL